LTKLGFGAMASFSALRSSAIAEAHVRTGVALVGVHGLAHGGDRGHDSLAASV
jgi:hypothetical protein